MVSRTKGAEYCYIQQQKQTTKKSEEHTREGTRVQTTFKWGAKKMAQWHFWQLI